MGSKGEELENTQVVVNPSGDLDLGLALAGRRSGIGSQRGNGLEPIDSRSARRRI